MIRLRDTILPRKRQVLGFLFSPYREFPPKKSQKQIRELSAHSDLATTNKNGTHSDDQQKLLEKKLIHQLFIVVLHTHLGFQI